MRHRMTNQMISATALFALAIPGLLGVTRPAKADNAPTPERIGQAWTRPKDGARMVAVPAGEFTMGEKGGPDNPEHQVTLDGYWIDKNLVTVAMYRKFCHDSGRKMPDPPEWGWKDDHPMVNVTWGDAKAVTWSCLSDCPAEQGCSDRTRRPIGEPGGTCRSLWTG